MVIEEAGDDPLQPFPLFGDRPVHTPSQVLLDFLELHPHAVAAGFPLEREAPAARSSADEGEAQEVEGLRLAKPAPISSFRRKAAELDQAGLVRMSDSANFRQPLAHLLPEASGIALMLEPDDDIVGVADDDHVARGLAPSPAFGPEVEGDGRDEP